MIGATGRPIKHPHATTKKVSQSHNSTDRFAREIVPHSRYDSGVHLAPISQVHQRGPEELNRDPESSSSSIALKLGMEPSTTSQEEEARIHTYHCLCTNVLLASTHPLSSLPRRSPEGKDNAYILPLPASSAENGGLDVALRNEDGDSRQPDSGYYVVLMNTKMDRKAIIVRKEDGFEKKYIQRCRRCNLTVGYQLDWSQWPEEERAGRGRRFDVVYLFSGCLRSTKEMMAGGKIEEG